MKIALVSILSEVHAEERINESLKDKYQILAENFELEEIKADEIPFTDFNKYDLTINFIKSGGTENIFAENVDYLPRPVYLLSTELHNSLPASLEILSFLNSERISGRILHGDFNEIILEIKELAAYKKVRDDIESARLGVIGQPSDWLIGSQIDYQHASHHWGIDFIDIELDQLYSAFEKVETEAAEKIAVDFRKKAVEIKESTEADLLQAAKIYLALKEVIAENDLDLVTVRCFDILEKLQTTGCLALSLLNNEGIIAGCEGDLPAAFSMFLAYKLCGEIPFMANPAAIDKSSDQILFAHCTIATDLTDEYTIRSHFESGIGVGIEGKLSQEEVTIFKIGGSGLEQFFVAEGRIIENNNLENACRTQLKVSLPQSSDYFLNDSIGNHHLIIPGHHADKISEFLGME